MRLILFECRSDDTPESMMARIAKAIADRNANRAQIAPYGVMTNGVQIVDAPMQDVLDVERHATLVQANQDLNFALHHTRKNIA